MLEKTLRETRALAVVRFGHRPPAGLSARPPIRQTPTDRTDYNTLRRSLLARSVMIWEILTSVQVLKDFTTYFEETEDEADLPQPYSIYTLITKDQKTTKKKKLL